MSGREAMRQIDLPDDVLAVLRQARRSGKPGAAASVSLEAVVAVPAGSFVARRPEDWELDLKRQSLSESLGRTLAGRQVTLESDIRHPPLRKAALLLLLFVWRLPLSRGSGGT